MSNSKSYELVELCSTVNDSKNHELDDQRSSVNEGALAIQIGGNHYKKFKIQPLEFCVVNNIPFAEGSIIKYILREKGKRFEDLQKARHILDYLIEIESQ